MFFIDNGNLTVGCSSDDDPIIFFKYKKDIQKFLIFIS
jgi:hypothetical protein